MNIIDAEIIQLLPFFLSKVLVATVCGFIIGLDRELKNKVAGIRTFILICVGTCLLTATSFYLAQHNTSIDPTRIIGQIITGIGFLGAGVIFTNQDKVVGVTTAAFIWVISAIGIIAGMGAILTPISLTLGLLILCIILEKFEPLIKKLKSNKDAS